MAAKNYSQTSRDRMVANMLIAMPVIAALVVIRLYQTRSREFFAP